MTCSGCKNKAIIVLPYSNKQYCKKCYSELIEKRIRKYIRSNKLLEKREVLLAKEPVVLFFLKRIIKNPNIRIVTKRIKQVTKEVLPWTLDDELNLYLKSIYTGSSLKSDNKKIIKMFLTIPETELSFFCKLQRVHFKPMKKQPFYKDFEVLAKKHPSIKFNLLKSMEHIK